MRQKNVSLFTQKIVISRYQCVSSPLILSAGAFQSPQLLMVSGIGPKATLEAHNIPVLHDNPNVGQNMVDHVWFGPAVRVKLETNSRWSDDPDYKLSV
jgi:choline dehydrogenase